MLNIVLAASHHKLHLTPKDSRDCSHSIDNIHHWVLSHHAFQWCDTLGILSVVCRFLSYIYSGLLNLYHRAMPVSFWCRQIIHCWSHHVLPEFIYYWSASLCICLIFVVVTWWQFIIAYAVNLYVFRNTIKVRSSCWWVIPVSSSGECCNVSTPIHAFASSLNRTGSFAKTLDCYLLGMLHFYDIENIRSCPCDRPFLQLFAAVQPSIIWSSCGWFFLAAIGLENCTFGQVLHVFDDITTDYNLNSLIYIVWGTFRDKVYVCASTIIRKSDGLNMSSANYGGWMGGLSNGRQCDCVYAMP
jgi:hypothetical protein